jgi:hypothetical protein
MLAESGGDQRTSYCGTNRLARARLRKYDVPEIDIRIDERDAHEAPVALLAQRSYDTLHRIGSMLVENSDGLARNQRCIHENQGAVGAYNVSGGFQVNRFAFGQAATHRQRNLKGEASRTPTFGIASSLHDAAFEETHTMLLTRCWHDPGLKASILTIWNC